MNVSFILTDNINIFSVVNIFLYKLICFDKDNMWIEFIDK